MNFVLICFDKVMNIICSNNFPLLHGTRRGVALGSRRILDQIIACGVGGVLLGAHAVSWVSARLFVPGARCWGHACGPDFLGRGAGGARLAQVPGVSRWVRALGPVVLGSRASEARHVSGVLGSVPGSLAEVQEARWLEGGVLGSLRLFGKSASWPRRESG